MKEHLEQLVRTRAAGRCEYCQMPEALFGGVPFHIEHIIARKHGGATNEQNLALACPHCNAYKGADIATLNPATGRPIRLFHPRRDTWCDHFSFQGVVVTGVTDRGRLTASLLRMNHDRMIAVRRELIEEGSFFQPS